MPRKKPDPIELAIEDALRPGQFIDYRSGSEFVRGLHQVKEQIDRLIAAGEPQRAASLYESIIAGCYEKTEEVDDSDGDLGTFAEGLFCGWIKARQAAKADPNETAERIWAWMENDDYGFCNELEREAVKVFNATGLRSFERVVRNAYDSEIAEVESDSQETKPRMSYTLQNCIGVLKSIYAAKGNIEAYLALCNEGDLTPRDCEVIAEIHEKRRRPAEALEWVEHGMEIEGRKSGVPFSLMITAASTALCLDLSACYRESPRACEDSDKDHVGIRT